MENAQQLKFTRNTILVPFLFVFTIWLVYWIEIHYHFNFNSFGVYPRTIEGLRGVFLMHFIHSDTRHLFNNSIPLMVLLGSLFYFYRSVALRILLLGGLLTGFLTWCIARDAYHIGASGLVYLLFSFVFFSGAIKRHYRLLALSLAVIFLYGSMIWYIFPVKDGMSWEGHLSGFITGLVCAYIYRNRGIQRELPVFTVTEFDLMFDEEGNLKENLPSDNQLTENADE